MRPRGGPGSVRLLLLALAGSVLVGCGDIWDCLIMAGFWDEAIESFRAHPEGILLGQSATLSWNASPFVECRIDPYPGEVGAGDGSVLVAPEVTTTFVLTCEEPEDEDALPDGEDPLSCGIGRESAQVTIEVVPVGAP